jgi:predicted O-methyltransferase YrrM
MTDDEIGVGEALAALMGKDSQRSREEPLIAANIGTQLAHMELTSWPIAIRRRVRDIVGRLQPKRICEVGAGIGHLSSWLLDMWEDSSPPEKYQLVEAGGKFGVILLRLLQRYDAGEWADVKVGRFEQLVAEQKAWSVANSVSTLTTGTMTGVTAGSVDALATPILHSPFDCIIIDVEIQSLAECLDSALTSLGKGGIILVVEPEVPTGDVAAEDAVGQSTIVGFQKWMDFIQRVTVEFDVAFQPLYGGTLVAIHSK